VIAYFDTSALVKLVVQEGGSEIASDIWDAADAVATGRLAYPEARAALAAAARAGRLSARAHRRAKSEFEALWQQMWVIELSASIAHEAGELAERQALRGYDAVHLAAALAIGDPQLVLVSWDADLTSAAGRASLVVAPVLSRRS
jgi:predicted nucleic acid-binding protein